MVGEQGERGERGQPDDVGEVLVHYEVIDEDQRLRSGANQIEFLRTQEVLVRHLPPGPARVLDVGGATGIHSQWLAEQGYEVTLMDLSPRHVEAARSSLSPLGVRVEQGDARALPYASDSFDAVLVLGPLYHLQDPSDRLAVWREARRVACPGGLVAAAAINRFASLLDGLARGYLFDPEFRAIVRRDLADGEHENPERHPGWFTTAYFHYPSELPAEAQAAGLEPVELVGLEGLSGWLPFDEDRWASPEDRSTILEAARVIEAEPSLSGLSAHLLMICRA